MSEKPLQTIRAGGVKATIWQNRGEGDQLFLTTTITRSYRDGNGDWKETNTFMPHQLSQLELVARKAYEFTQLGREASRDPGPASSEQAEIVDKKDEGGAIGQDAEDQQQGEFAGVAAADGTEGFAGKVERRKGGSRSR